MTAWARMDAILARAEQALLVFCLALMMVTAFAQIAIRNLLGIGLTWSEPLVRYLVLWVGFLGAALAVRSILDRNPGEVLLVGCPAEEKGGGVLAALLRPSSLLGSSADRPGRAGCLRRVQLQAPDGRRDGHADSGPGADPGLRR